MAREPRGLRNNNPGNIRRTSTRWQGMADVQSDPEFAVFEKPEMGIRALGKVLKTYRDRHGLETVRGIINRWAPPNENDTDSYVNAVSQAIGVDPDDKLDISNLDTAASLTQAIIRHENGQQPFDEETIRAGLELAGLQGRTGGFTEPPDEQAQTEQEVFPAGGAAPGAASPFRVGERSPETAQLEGQDGAPLTALEQRGSPGLNAGPGRGRVLSDLETKGRMLEDRNEGTGLLEQLMAPWEVDNMIVNLVVEAATEAPEPEPGFNPMDHLKPGEELVATEFVGARSRGDMVRIRKEIAREREMRRQVAEGPLPAILATAPAVLLDLDMLLPFGALRKGAGLGENIVRGTVAGGAANAFAESILQATQRERPIEETVGAVLLGSAFGSVIGGVGGAYMARKTKAFSEAVDDFAEIARASDPNLRPLTPDAAGADVTPNRLSPEDTILEQGIGGRTLAEAVAKLGRWGMAAPSLELAASRFAKSREFVNKLVDIGMGTKGTFRGYGGPAPVDTRIRSYDRVIVGGMRFLKNQHGMHKQAGGGLSHGRFLEEVGKAMRRNDDHPDPTIAQASKFVRENVFDPLKDAMIKRGEFPEDIDVSTAMSYFTRVYDRQKVRARRPEFKGRVEAYLNRTISADEGFDPVEIGDMADRIIDTILGFPAERTNRINISEVVKRGPLKERTFLIPDEEIEDFLVSSVDEIMSRYVKTMAADIEFIDAFGRADATDDIARAIKDEANELAEKATSEAERLRIDKQAEREIAVATTLARRIRGTDIRPGDGAYAGLGRAFQPAVRVGKAARDLNFMRLLGMVTVSSIPDAGKIVFEESLSRAAGALLVDFGRGFEAIKLAKKEGQAAGTIFDIERSSTQKAVLDIGERYVEANKIERLLDRGSQKFAGLVLINRWNSVMKSITSMLAQSRILRTIDKLQRGKPLSRFELRKFGRSGIDEAMIERIAKEAQNWQRMGGGVIIARTADWADQGAVNAFRNALLKDIDNTIITPGAGDAPLWTSTEWGKSVFQFKRFGMASVQRTVISGLQARDMATLNGIMLMVGLGAFSQVVRDYATKGEVQDRTGREWAVDAIDRSGAMAIFMEGDALFDKASGGNFSLARLAAGREPDRFAARDILGQLGGPSVGLVEDMRNASANALSGEFTQSDLQKFRRLLPGQNVPGIAHLLNAGVESTGLPEKN